MGHIGWADLIFVMERKHLRRLKEKFGLQLQNKPIHCIDISDDYGYMDEELIEILKARVSEFIDVPD
jgi:predicted protein tyrosine phosphatase